MSIRRFQSSSTFLEVSWVAHLGLLKISRLEPPSEYAGSGPAAPLLASSWLFSRAHFALEIRYLSPRQKVRDGPRANRNEHGKDYS